MGDAYIHTSPTQSKIDAYKVTVYCWKDLPIIYHNLILSKWLRTFRHGNDFIRLIDSNTYYSVYKIYINRILNQLQTSICIAALSDDPDVVLGFSVSRPHILDYVYVHKDMRRLGIGSKLIPTGINCFTHLTKTWLTIWNDKYKALNFNPFI